MSASAQDAKFLARAIRLAERGLYGVNPNPMVGCVLVRDGEIVAEGWHQQAGGPHAEIDALNKLDHHAQGCTAYVSLEPCNHMGRTGPCSHALLKAGVTRVVYAAKDEGAKSHGGCDYLQAHGVSCEHMQAMQAQAQALNPGMHQRMRGGRPYMRLKMAQSFDAKTALPNGQSQWISSAAARKDGHRWRARSCAVVTGIGTVLADDPRLTVRAIDSLRQPVRVVLDSQLRTPKTAAIRGDEAPTTILHSQSTADDALGIYMPANNGQLDLKACVEWLGQQGYNEILIEAGAKLSGAFLAAGLIDELIVYTAPRYLGPGRASLDLPTLEQLNDSWDFRILEQRRFGEDLRTVLKC